MIQLNEEKYLEEIEKLKRQLSYEYAEGIDLKRENYALKVRVRVLRHQWEEMYIANLSLANKIKSLDRDYFERVEAEKEGKSDYKGVQV